MAKRNPHLFEPWFAPRLAILAAMMVAASAPLSMAQTIAWKTGPLFHKAVEAEVAVTWKQNPLRRALHRLAETQQVAILLDRRIDPDRKVDYAVGNMSLRALMDGLGKQELLGVNSIGPVVYFGPAETARKLPTLAAQRREDFAKLTVGQRQRVSQPKPASWNELDTPREILEKTAMDVGMVWHQPEKIPHDLWPAVSLPPLDLADRLTLVLAGFDLTYEISRDGTLIRTIPIPEKVSITRTYPAGKNAASFHKQLTNKFAKIPIRLEGDNLIVEGTLEEHLMVATLLRGESVTRTTPVGPPGSKRVFTLKIDGQPVGDILKALGKQVPLEMEYAPEVNDKLTQVVSFDVREATLERLLRAVCEPAGLDFILEGKRVKVIPGKK